MKYFFKNLRWVYKLSGFNFKTLTRSLRSIPFYWRTSREFKKQARQSKEPFTFGAIHPVLHERFQQAGSASGHYFHQDIYVAQKIFENNPQRHIDVGSRVDGFVAHVASYRKIEVIDVRPMESQTENIDFLCADMMGELPEHLIESTDSLSCLHALEHFGLGRYGDPVNFEGHLIGLENLYRMVKPGGTFYFSTPIGKEQRIEFNAHRVFSVPYLMQQFENRYELISFAYVGDDAKLHTEINIDSDEAKESFGLKYGCGIFELKKN